MDVQQHDGNSVHVTSVRTLVSVFATLLVLTATTVAVGQLDLGPWEIWVTMFIATLKAGLVAIYFMHLRHDNAFNAMIFGFSFFFVALFIGFTMVDVEQYQPDLIPSHVEPSANVSQD